MALAWVLFVKCAPMVVRSASRAQPDVTAVTQFAGNPQSTSGGAAHVIFAGIENPTLRGNKPNAESRRAHWKARAATNEDVDCLTGQFIRHMAGRANPTHDVTVCRASSLGSTACIGRVAAYGASLCHLTCLRRNSSIVKGRQRQLTLSIFVG